MTARARREAVRWLSERNLSTERGCALLGIRRSSFYYRSRRPSDRKLVEELRTIARENKRYGYRRAWALLRRRGEEVNRKKVERLWRESGLGLPRRRPRKRHQNPLQTPIQALYPGHVVTYDFMLDETMDGRRLRVLTLVDEFSRESPAIEAARRMPARDVIDVLERTFETWGWPEWLRSDNGPEFIARRIREWLALKGVKTHYIDPGCPWQNPYGESFNDKVRSECLSTELFWSVPHARITLESWRRHYNQERPHMSLGYRTPAEYRAEWNRKKKKGNFLFDRPIARRLAPGWGRSKRKNYGGV